MTLTQIRARVKTITGRFDLVNADGSDNGMDFYIKAATRYLDMTTNIVNSHATYRKDLAAGDYKVTFKQARSIHRAWVYSASEDKRVQLVEKTLEEIKEEYAKDLSGVTQGTPKYYARFILRLQPDQQDTWANEAAFLADGSAAFTEEYQDVLFGDYHPYTGILVMPPADGAYTLTLQGHFFSKEMTDDAHKNFWSEQYPELLVYATAYCIEADYRNTRGANDWINVMQPLKMNLEFDMIEQESANTDQMNG